MDFFLELAVKSIVRETSEQLCGDRHLETAMKKSLAPKKEDNSNNVVAAALAKAVAGNAAVNEEARENNNN